MNRHDIDSNTQGLLDMLDKASRRATRVMPTRPKNAEVRSREHLTPDEVQRMIQAAGTVGRQRERDALLIMMMYQHGLRVSEAIRLRWDHIDMDSRLLFVVRVKRGSPATHPLSDTVSRKLRFILYQFTQEQKASYVFTSERRGQLSDSTVRRIIRRAGDIAGLGFPVHPHQLRHACGYYLASQGIDTRAIQAYLGHRNIASTVRYTEISPDRFKGFWDK